VEEIAPVSNSNSMSLFFLLGMIFVLVAAVVIIKRRKRTHAEPIVANPPYEPTAAKTSPSPTIQLVHSSDARQHTGELKSILMRMKEENRISDFTSHDVSIDPDNITFKNEDHQGIIVMLTNELGQFRSTIETSLKNTIQESANKKLIEIIVDNLPYHNEFISLPNDLVPIRSRADMNTIWKGIEYDLQAIFPKHEIEKPDVPLPPVIKPETKPNTLRIVLTITIVGIISFFMTATFGLSPAIALVFFVCAAGLSVFILNRGKRQSAPSGNLEVGNGKQVLRGIVKGYQQRFEIESFHNKPKVVWTFRIDCFENGKLVNTIPVQMVGNRFKGDINDGDDVEVFRWRKGTVLETNRVKNWTTGIEVRSSSGNALQALGWIIFLLGLAFIVFLMVNGMG
jgi:hypothetical protein